MVGVSYADCFKSEIRLLDGSKTKALVKLQFEDDRDSFQCNACRVAEIHGEKNLLMHVNGKKHLTNLDRVHDPSYFPIQLKGN